LSEIERDLAAVAEAAFNHDSRFDRFGQSNFWMRFLVFLNDLSLYLLRRSLLGASRARSAIPALLRLHDELAIGRPDIITFIIEVELELAEIPDALPAMPWVNEKPPIEAEGIPKMIELDAMRYYIWLGRTLDITGAIVELGPWMGGSTACLAIGLRRNSCLGKRKLHVFDSFIWRDWMAQFATDPALSARYREGDNFIEAFRKNCATFHELIEVTQCELSSSEAGSGLLPLRWSGGPVGALIVDHSDRYQENSAAWSVFASSFVSGRTIVVFNQYGNLRAEELRRFCRDHSNELAPLHHLVCSGRAFLFTGQL
jgi:hypothetical protein